MHKDVIKSPNSEILKSENIYLSVFIETLNNLI